MSALNTSDAMTHNPILVKKLEQMGLWELLSEVGSTEIVINQPHLIFTETNGVWKEIYSEKLTFDNLEQLVQLIANQNGIAINNDNPIASVKLPTGERVQICIPPVTLDNHISITIRRYSKDTKSLDELNQGGTFDNASWTHITDYSKQENIEHLSTLDKELLHLIQKKDIASFLRKAVQSHKNLILIGRTGSGKTFATRSLIDEISASERIVTIEDVHELFLDKFKNKTHLIFNSTSKNGVSAKQALASCMRMKPDRIFLAEIRGDEAWDYICSLNTGHPGSITSAHANGSLEAYSRICSLIKSSPVGQTLDQAYIEYELFNTIHISLFFDKKKLVDVFFDPLYAKTKALT